MAAVGTTVPARGTVLDSTLRGDLHSTYKVGFLTLCVGFTTERTKTVAWASWTAAVAVECYARVEEIVSDLLLFDLDEVQLIYEPCSGF